MFRLVSRNYVSRPRLYFVILDYLFFFSVVAMHLCYLDQGNKILGISDDFGILNHEFSEWCSFQNFLEIPRVVIVLQFGIHGVSYLP